MKAVILAGGLGTRMREETEFKPKPMVEIGGRPVLWHIMRMLSDQGIKEFVILGGYRVSAIKDYFANLLPQLYDFTVEHGALTIHSDSEPEETSWRVSVVDTGLETQTAGRLLRAKEHIGDDPFLLTYGDGLADINFENLLAHHVSHKRPATMTVFQPQNRFGVVQIGADAKVEKFKEKPRMSDYINIGYFILNHDVWSHITADEPFEEGPLKSLSVSGSLTAFEHSGFWEPMDNYREYVAMNTLWDQSRAPWATWMFRK
jgi:glucose-1-phosphate cytidylyltransferase